MSILEALAERRIVQAQREGAFVRLRGEGQPLRLEADEHVPPEWRAAFRMLQQAGLAPDWIALGREIDAALGEVRRSRSQRGGQASARRREEDEIEEINRQIDRFNLIAPHPIPRRERVRLADEGSLGRRATESHGPAIAGPWHERLG